MWREIQGYEGYYEISDSCEVRGIDRYIDLPNGKKRFVPGKKISSRINNCGYVYVRLSKNGKTKSCVLHRLIAIAFIPNPLDLPQVNHLKTKLDNYPADLEWSSVSDNTLHSYRTGLNPNQAGDHFFAVGVIDNEIGMEFSNIRDWCLVRGIPYSTGRNILSGCNTSKKIDKTKIVKFKPKIDGQIESAS